MRKERNPLIAFILSFLSSGLGQIYNGQLKKGIIFSLLTLSLFFIFGITRWCTFFIGFCALMSIELVLKCYVLIDAIIQANKQKDYKLKSINKGYYYLIYYCLFFGLAIGAFSILGVEALKVASPSSSPTLQVNEKFLGDLKAYNNSKPEYGDIALFNKEEYTWLFRVIGLPGDTIRIEDSLVYINSKPVVTQNIGTSKIEKQKVQIRTNYLPNKLEFNTYHNIDKRYREPISHIVSGNHYFVMGDNRDNALDSRYIGAIPLSNIKGKAKFIFWSQDLKRIGTNLTQSISTHYK